MSYSDFVLEGEERQKVGKSSAHKARMKDRIPAVLYGPDIKDNVYFTIDYKKFEKAFKTFGKNILFTLACGGKKFPVIIKDYKIHPVTRYFLHADFYVVSPKKNFTTEVPVRYIGTPIGVKEGGGLYVFTRQVKINTDLDNLPSSIEVDISQLKPWSKSNNDGGWF
jgi:large subunit ribosomal protein L25